MIRVPPNHPPESAQVTGTDMEANLVGHGRGQWSMDETCVHTLAIVLLVGSEVVAAPDFLLPVAPGTA